MLSLLKNHYSPEQISEIEEPILEMSNSLVESFELKASISKFEDLFSKGKHSKLDEIKELSFSNTLKAIALGRDILTHAREHLPTQQPSRFKRVVNTLLKGILGISPYSQEIEDYEQNRIVYNNAVKCSNVYLDPKYAVFKAENADNYRRVDALRADISSVDASIEQMEGMQSELEQQIQHSAGRVQWHQKSLSYLKERTAKERGTPSVKASVSTNKEASLVDEGTSLLAVHLG